MNIAPDYATIEELAKQYNTIPICRELYADVATPIQLLRRLMTASTQCFLLESVEGGERWARYSFLGYAPTLRVTCREGQVTLQGAQNRVVTTDRPLDVLRELLAGRRAPRIPGFPSFTGGFVGAFGYGMIGYAEPSLRLSKGSEPDFDVMLFERVVAYDHLRQKICVIANVDAADLQSSYARALADIQSICALIADNSPLPQLPADTAPQFTCSMSAKRFCAVVERAKEYILDGDIFQAVLSRRFESAYTGSLLNAYRVLRTTNPSPYMVYLRMDDREIICSSPETLVRLEEGRLTAFPLAGSRPRGKTEEQDAVLQEELLRDEKELSEHNMLVDLARNDVGRVAAVGSVRVAEYLQVQRYSRVMHIASRVEGDLRADRDALDALAAILPAGTLSGAPKIRACQIIDELEASPRGFYGGAIGYVDFAGNLDTCIAIRMAVRAGGKVTVQAGAGIVADSVPMTEYEESANKAGAVIAAIQRAAEVDAK